MINTQIEAEYDRILEGRGLEDLFGETETTVLLKLLKQRIENLEIVLRAVAADRPSAHSDAVWEAIQLTLNPVRANAPVEAKPHPNFEANGIHS